MTEAKAGQHSRLKTLILAAGPGYRDGKPYLKALEPLEDRCTIDFVANDVARQIPPEDTIIVVGFERDKLIGHLGEQYDYVVQDEQLGTGHAILQAAPLLRDYDGDVLILYGDTPLLRSMSIQGMLTRHALRNADLTLLTTVTDQQLPYGRIVRDSSGRIVDIIEEEDATGYFQDIRELNVGAYVARASALFSALDNLKGRSHIRLPDIVHLLIRAGQKVESYTIYDPGEILGINTDEDRAEAEFILQKRYLRPMRAEEENQIRFGTGGWRAIIGEGFTFGNIRRLCQALANLVVREGNEAKGVLIGFDRRFLSGRAGQAAAEVFAGNNIKAFLMEEDAPTPLITYATSVQEAALGLAFTASHNPPEWNGLKVFRSDGSLLNTDETNAIEDEANRLTTADVVKLELDLGLVAGIIESVNHTNAYIDSVESFIDLHAIREAGLSILIDPMYGVGQLTLATILTEARCRVTTIHERHDPLFGGRSPTPDLHALSNMIRLIKEGRYDMGLAMDGDADRIALVDEAGSYVEVNDILLMLYYYLRAFKGQRGGVVRNIATSHMLDRLARHFGESSYEVPVGFKHVAATMDAHDCLLGGESSGGLTIRGHIKGKDGILAAVLIVEMLAKTGKSISALREAIYEITGRLFTLEVGMPATPEMKIIIPQRLVKHPIDAIGPYPVQSMSYEDGTKFLLENDNWLLIRFSGTEPLLRIVAEADSPEKAEAMVEWARRLTQLG